MRKRNFVAAAAASLVVAGFHAGQVEGAAFGPGDLVVVQDGDGSAALTGNATAAFLNEYNPNFNNNPTQAPAQQIALPTAASGTQKALTLSGTATSEGFLTLSSNGTYLTVGGYNAAPGTASVTSGVGNRVVGRIDLNGNVDTSTLLGDSASLGNIRSTVSDDGNNMWVATSSGGVRYTTFGSTGATVQLSSSPTNTRVANIFGSTPQLYISSASGTVQGVATIGTGKPTTSGQTTTILPGFPTATGPSNYDYFFANANTVYVADDRGTGTLNTGGLEKWVLSGGTWTDEYTLVAGLTAGLRGLAGTTDGSGNAILYATTADTASKLVAITDQISAATLPGTESFTTIATAGTNTAFRGVELLPGTAVVPEPAALGLGAIALGLTLGRRPRRSIHKKA